MLLGLDVEQLSRELNAALDDHHSHLPLRDILVGFAEDNNIPL